jgi:hypothetical protein
MAKCTARNGGFNCQHESPSGQHGGRHYAYYIGAGLPYIAYWVDMYSQVYRIKAPKPTLPQPR